MSGFVCPVSGCQTKLPRLQVMHFRASHDCDPSEWVCKKYGSELGENSSWEEEIAVQLTENDIECTYQKELELSVGCYYAEFTPWEQRAELLEVMVDGR